MLSRWRLSSTHAVSSANKVLQANTTLAISTANSSSISSTGGGSSGGVSGISSNHGSNLQHNNSNRRQSVEDRTNHATDSSTDKDYSDPFAAYKLLLEGARQVQKQFFPPHNNNNSSSSSNSSISTPNISRRGSVNIASKSQSPPQAGFDFASSFSLSFSGDTQMSSKVGGFGGNDKSGAISCSGLSDSLRIEIAATLNLNSVVKTQDIESVDRAFAFACANQLEKLMTSLVGK